MSWPALDYAADHETWQALHLWTQVVGKVRLALTPWVNHSWHVPLYVSPRGLTTGLVHHPAGAFDLELDFRDHCLRLRSAGGAEDSLPLAPGSVTSGSASTACTGLASASGRTTVAERTASSNSGVSSPLGFSPIRCSKALMARAVRGP